MLTYLINVTGDLLAVSLIIGIIFAFIERYCADYGKVIFRIGFALGIIAAASRAYITNTRRLTGGWKVGAYGYGISLILVIVCIVLFIVFSRSFFTENKGERLHTVSHIIVSVSISLLTASYLYCTLPNVFIYPFKFDTGGNGILSTDYLFRLGGYFLGIIICVTSAVATYKIAVLACEKGFSKLICLTFYILNLIYSVNNFAKLMLVLTPRKIVDSVALFNFAAASNNRSHWYTFIVFGILIALSVFLWVKSYVLKEPYTTKAQHRKHRAKWRSIKRHSIVLAVCFVCAILCSTLFVKLNTVVIREAPVEDPILSTDDSGEPELLIPLESVMDGHLHRFGYKTDEGNLVRFIVVLKQENTTNYGVGLDACEICGEAGYYENKDEQVVCKKCGVVMNRTTIGMKGGCNPIIIDYDINESYITVPVSEMIKNQDRFKN